MVLEWLSDDGWIVLERNIDRDKLRFQETIFTLGNGYVGSRGVLEEGYRQGYPGTYITGVYDSGGQLPEIVNAPNPVVVEIYVDGRKLSLDEMGVIEHRRILDMKRAVLYRRTLFVDGEKRYKYRSSRFLSLREQHLGVMSFSLEALDCDASVTVKCVVDGTTRNEIQAVGDPVRHYTVMQTYGMGRDPLYLAARTDASGIVIGLASLTEAHNTGGSCECQIKSHGDENCVFREFSFQARRGKRYSFTRYFSVYTSRDTQRNIHTSCLAEVMRARERGAAQLLRRHTRCWRHRWRYSDVAIDGDPAIRQAVRFNLYHLLIAASPEDMDVSLPAKALSGEWYKGHVFWDTEIYMFPFFMYTQPKIARNLLLYRYRRLEQARHNASMQGYKGTLFPWESADTGEEVTPMLWRGPDGKIIKVHTKPMQHHIVGDISWAVSMYYMVTGDIRFMLDYGAEVIFESARFWASRVNYDEDTALYHIPEVTGPDEYHKGVDDSFYTNYLARWNLLYAASLYREFLGSHPRYIKKLGDKMNLPCSEVDAWQQVGGSIKLGIQDSGLIEEFQGYFDKGNDVITQRNASGMPVYSKDEDKLQHTQLVKQADVILLLHLFPGDFSRKTREINFAYYDARTTHLSSLSPSIYAILAAELGDISKAYNYFHYVACGDLDDYFGNTDLGIHAASLGGVWQAAIHGFAGVKLVCDRLYINPKLPEKWRMVKFNLLWRGNTLRVCLSNDKVEILLGSRKKQLELPACIYGKRIQLQANKLLTVVK
ncbi:MAG: glycoside hydrolase family 65 protein [Dehalococcoidia bacterium]|nr:glycoside hydrolase family 65 protein [Dehalococcoidia bacterium]